MDDLRRSKSGIKEVRGRLSKQIERTQKLKFPTGEDAIKYWFRPPDPDPIDLSKPPAPDETNDVVSDLPIDELPQAKSCPKRKKSSIKKQVTHPAIIADTRPARKQRPPTVPETYSAWVMEKAEDGTVTRKIIEKSINDLASGEADVLIRVDYSSLNYKDALAASGHSGVAGKSPLTPGIDAAGVVAESHSPIYSPGDEVIVTGFDLGTYFDGGFGRYIRVPAEWIVRCPPSLDLTTAMAYGTAGFTAAQSVNELERNGIGPRSGEILVTGATGGVGSIAVALLAQVGYDVVAVTGKASEHDYLYTLGAKTVLDRNEFLKGNSKRSMHTSRWAGIVDTTGGELLELGLKEAHYGAAVTCCGMVAGAGLSTSIYPFILRGVRLIGIDSAMCLLPMRNRLWRRIANEWYLSCLEPIMKDCSLSELDAAIETMLKGESQGRIIVCH